MKSIIYLCGGKPHNLDDCLDIVDKGLSAHVHLNLSRCVQYLDSDAVIYLIGKYTWKFPEYFINFEKTYGAYLSLQAEKGIQSEIDGANKRLYHDLSRITKANVHYQGQHIFKPKPLW